MKVRHVIESIKSYYCTDHLLEVFVFGDDVVLLVLQHVDLDLQVVASLLQALPVSVGLGEIVDEFSHV